MKKPLAVWAAEIGLLLTIFGYAGLVARCVRLFAQPGAEPARLVPGVLIGVAVIVLAVLLLLQTREQKTTRRRLLSFFWGMLALYPLTNILVSLGYFPLPVRLPPEQLAGAAYVEILRYVLLLGLIVWLGSSRKAAGFVAARRIPELSAKAQAAISAAPGNP